MISFSLQWESLYLERQSSFWKKKKKSPELNSLKPGDVNKSTIVGSDNGLSPGRRQAIIWTNAGLLLIVPLGTNFNEILIEILTFSFKKMRLKVPSAKQRLCCLGLNVLRTHNTVQKMFPVLSGSPVIIECKQKYEISRQIICLIRSSVLPLQL